MTDLSNPTRGSATPAPRSAHGSAPTPDEVLASLSARRSFKLKDLDPRPIDLALVDRMLEAANWAPSHGKTEPWRFVVFTGEERERLSRAFGEAYRALNPEGSFAEAGLDAQRAKPRLAPVWIALGVEPSPTRPEWEELIAFGCAVHNAQLMACALGLGSKWTSGAVVTHPIVRRAIGFSDAIQLRGFLYVGRPAVAWPAGERRPIEEKVRWVPTPTP
ncbi:MAG: nitroreductase [Gemmatimonadetes bacterium]|nr:nitroreductase [Gemmatimonadota bacterium]